MDPSGADGPGISSSSVRMARPAMFTAGRSTTIMPSIAGSCTSAGQVVEVIDGLIDNEPGHLDQPQLGQCRGGTDPRFWVVLAHLAQHSIMVRPGDQVQVGTPIGTCGNSGYSPQPHLHLHVQIAAQLGSATLPFTICNWQDASGQCWRQRVPAEGSLVQALPHDRVLAAAFTPILDRQWYWHWQADGTAVGSSISSRLRATWLTSPGGRLAIYQGVAGGRLVTCSVTIPICRCWLVPCRPYR